MDQLCFHDPHLRIMLVQTGFNKFTVTYFKQVTPDLDYANAAAELGRCIMHAVACDGRLDSRTAWEAKRHNGDRKPYYEHTVAVPRD